MENKDMEDIVSKGAHFNGLFDPSIPADYSEGLENFRISKDLPTIDKLSYSLRKNVEGKTMVFVGKDYSQGQYDPFAIPGFDEMDDETAISQLIFDYLYNYIRENIDPEDSSNTEKIEFYKKEAKTKEAFIELEKKLEECKKDKNKNMWRDIGLDDGDPCTGLMFGTISEAFAAWDRTEDPAAYINQTRVYTSENGFAMQEKILSESEVKEILTKEHEARDSWVKEYGATPAIDKNTNTKSRDPNSKPRGIRRL